MAEVFHHLYLCPASKFHSWYKFLGCGNYLYYIHHNNRLFNLPIQGELNAGKALSQPDFPKISPTPKLKRHMSCWFGKLNMGASLSRTLGRACLTTDASDHR